MRVLERLTNCPVITLLYIIVGHLDPCTMYMRCGQKEKTITMYHLVRPCTNSKMGRLASANLLTPNSCMIFARKNNGLAFSFLPEGIDPLQENEEEEVTCNVFECPEFESTLSLQHVSPYHYYSLYAQPLPSLNVTCIPGIGVFTVHFDKANYTQAKFICENNGGELASILTDLRTRLLAELLSNLCDHKRNIKAYIGLDDIENEGTFVSSNVPDGHFWSEAPRSVDSVTGTETIDDGRLAPEMAIWQLNNLLENNELYLFFINGQLLECSMYRAWAPGEPHAKMDDEDCVVLNSQQMWQVVRCNRKLPFICEISPAEPIKLCSNGTLTAKHQCLVEHINRTETMKENSRCRLPPSYEKNATDMLDVIETALNNTNNSTKEIE